MSSAPLTVIYPGTFDPITNGHLDLIRRASELFEKVIVGITAGRSSKHPVFSAAERLALATEVLSDLPRVEAQVFSGLLIDYARARGARVVLRGLRAVSDFEYEFQLANLNRQLYPELETMFMMPAERYTYLSSSLVREIAMLGGNVAEFVPAPVQLALQRLSLAS